MIEIEQPLRAIHQYEWEQKKYPEEWRKYFRHEVVLEWKRYRDRWVFAQPDLFELKVELNWQWYYREVYPAVETRLSELNRWIELHLGWQRYGRMRGQRQSYWNYHSKKKKRAALQRIAHSEIEQAYIHFPEVDLTASTRCGQISFRRIRAKSSSRVSRVTLRLRFTNNFLTSCSVK